MHIYITTILRKPCTTLARADGPSKEGLDVGRVAVGGTEVGVCSLAIGVDSRLPSDFLVLLSLLPTGNIEILKAKISLKCQKSQKYLRCITKIGNCVKKFESTLGPY